MNRQALTGALADHDRRRTPYSDTTIGPLVAAARLVERLLPGECEMCEGVGKFGHFDIVDCRVCHGSGRVWDEGIVEAVAKAITATYSDHSERLIPRASFVAEAVLSALVELLTEKVE